MDDAVLDLFGNLNQVHILPASRRALYLMVIVFSMFDM